jgi:hypothetical protein
MLMGFVSWFLAEVIGGVVQSIFEAAANALGVSANARAKRRFREFREVPCGIRGKSTRVAGFSTEWSGGLALVSPGHITFTPTIGVVGVHEIPITGFDVTPVAGFENENWVSSPTTRHTVVAQSPNGELYLALPQSTVADVHAVVMGT